MPTRPLNACNTGWPGGWIHVPVGATVPPGFRRGRYDAPPGANRGCYPSVGGFTAQEATGGALGAAIAAGRTQAAALEVQRRQEEYRRLLRTPLGTSVEANNAFALRFVEDVCRPFVCYYFGPTWQEAQSKGVRAGRGPIEDVARQGATLAPLDITAVRVALGREPTGSELIAACGDERNLIRPGRFRTRSGQWATVRATRPGGAAVVTPLPPGVVLKSGAAPTPGPAGPAPGLPDPFAPGTPVFACRRLTRGGRREGYAGPYVPGMVNYWQGYQGGVFLTAAEADAACVQDVPELIGRQA